jgi:hypothetical protein
MRKEAVVAKFGEPVWLEKLKTTKYVRIGSFSCWVLNHGHFGYKAGLMDIRLRIMVKLCKLTPLTGYYIWVDFSWAHYKSLWIVLNGFHFRNHYSVVVTNSFIKYEDRMTQLLLYYVFICLLLHVLAKFCVHQLPGILQIHINTVMSRWALDNQWWTVTLFISFTNAPLINKVSADNTREWWCL